MREFYLRLLTLAKFICLMCIASYSFAQVSGTVFQDFNGNGQKDNSASFNEVGLKGVTVIATDPSGNQLAVSYEGNGTSTNASGNYSVSGGTLGMIRLEFVMPDGHTFASKGGVSGTTIMFPTAANQNLAVFYPQTYSSETDPRVATLIYSNGDNQINNSTAASPRSIVSFPYENGDVNTMSNMGRVGATWGLAYHKQSGKLFSASFAKRHVNTGPLGLGGIYVTENAKSSTTATATSNFVNLSAINTDFNVGTVNRNFSPGNGNANASNYDQHIFDLIGKIGLGDLSVSDDGQYLYTVNLNDRRLWRIEVGINGVAPTQASQINQYAAFPDPCTSSTFRPFALRFYKGDIYIGGVCDGVGSTGVNRGNLKGTIFKVSATADPATATFTEVFSFPLTYDRDANVEGAIKAGSNYFDPNHPSGTNSIKGASWRPWLRSFSDLPSSYTGTYRAYPQPMLLGMEFDTDGSLILGFGDRTGHQFGNLNYLPNNLTNTTEVTWTSGGDLLRAYNNNGTYVLENNGTAGGVSTGGVNNGQGPGGGEFYWRDVFHFNGSNDNTATAPYGVRSGTARNFHEETSLGGLTGMAGKGSVLVTSFDPRRTSVDQGQFSGGIRWYSNSDGSIANGLTLYDMVRDGSNFGKAGGIGDIELMTNPAPIEIGNRVWLDTNNNGIQDAGENGLPGITVTLYAANGTTVIATAATNAQGEYYFSSATGTNTTNAIYGLNILPQTAYVLSYPTTSGVNLISTKPNSGTNDLLDSDADGLGKITFTTGSAGENNHSFDVGYFVCPTVTAPVIANAARCDEGTFTASITTGCTTGYSLNIFSDEALTNNVTSSFTISGTSITSPSLSATTTYHVNCSDGVCSSTKSSFELTINSAPAISVNSPEICAGETATLEVTGCTGGTITWTNGLTGTTATTPALTATTTYTATCTVGDCISTAVASVTVNALPVITVDKPTICSGETATLTVTGCEGGTITWSGGLSGTSAVTPVLTETTSYIATCSEGGCSSTAVVTVVSAPAISVNSPEICTGETTTLEVTGCTGGTITWTNGLTGTTATTPALTASATYTATCTEGDCISTAVASVTVNALPVITVDKPTICSGETATLTVTGCEGGTITWSGGLSGTSAVTPVLTETTSYIATCSEGGCSSTAVVTVVSAPAISVNSPEICAGETATLEVTGCTGGTITWTNGLTGTTATTPALTASATYTATCTVGDCISTAVASVTVNALPVITVVGEPVCAPDGLSYSVLFTIPAGAILSNTTAGIIDGDSVVNILSGATAVVTVKSAEGCENTATVTYNCELPCVAPNSTVEGTAEICVGESAILEAEGCTTGFTYLWSTNETTASITVNPTATTVYTVKCVNVDDAACVSVTPASATITVNEKAAAPTGITATPSEVILGDESVLTATCAGGLTPSWFEDSALTIPLASTTVSPTVNTTYYVICGVDKTCAEVEDITVTVTDAPCVAPNPTVEGTAEICVGESAILEAEGCTTGFTYLWSTNETTASITVNPTETTVYTVRCVNVDDAACVSVTPASATITVNEKAAAPTGVTATPSEVILGDESVLTATCAGGLTPSWFEDSALTTPLTSTTVSPTVNTTYYVICGVDKTCAEIEDITVTVTDAPCVAPNPTVDGTAEICVGESAILEAEGCTTGFTYLWSTNETTASITVNPTETTVYTVRCVNVDDAACVSVTPASATITVNEKAAAPTGVTATPATISAGEESTLTAVCANGLTATWFEDEDLTIPLSGNMVTPAVTTTYYVICGTNTTCSIPASGKVIVDELIFDLALRKVLPVGPKNPTVSPGDSVTFRIDVFNQGNVDATDVHVIDYIPNGLTLADSNWVLGTGVATLKDPIAALVSGDSVSVNITFVVNGDQLGSVRNFAEISGADNAEGLEDIDSTPDTDPDNDGTPDDDNLDGDHKNNPDEDEDDHDFEEITVRPALVFDLALRKVLPVGPKNPTVSPGDSVTFRIDVFNQGNVDATDVHVIDYIPNGLTLADSNWVLGTGVATLKDPIAALASGDSVSVNITFVVNGDQLGSVRNFAEITRADNAEGLEDIDSTPDTDPDNDGTPDDDNLDGDHKNNPDEDEDDHDFEEITVRPALVFDLALRKVLPVGPKNPTVSPGDSVTFRIDVFNQGNVDATDVHVIDYIPNGLTLADSNWVLGTGVATLKDPIAALASGDSVSVNITFVVNGDQLGSVRNFAEITGADNAEGLEDIDSTPDTDPDNDGTPDDDNLDGDHKNNPDEDEDDHDFEEITVRPDLIFDLALRKVLPSGEKNPTVRPGDSITFEIKVYNQGNVDATDIEIADTIPDGLSLNDTNWSEAVGVASLINPIATLAAGDSTSVTIVFTIDADFTGRIRNVARITDYKNEHGLEDIDSDPDKEGVKDDEIDEHGIDGDDEDSNDFEEITVSPDLFFDLALRKTMTAGSKTIFKTGDTVSFDITVFNQGTVAATTVDLVDYIPAGLTLQDSSWTLDGNKARWIGAITDLAPGAQRTVTISFVVDSSATGVIINSAEISGAENDENLEDIDSTPDDDKDNDGPVKDDEINEDGKDGRDEDDHDIEPITICPNAKCLNVKVTRIK